MTLKSYLKIGSDWIQIWTAVSELDNTGNSVIKKSCQLI